MICCRSWSITKLASDIDPTDGFGLFDDLARIFHHLPGDAQQFAVLGFLLLLPLLGGHPFDLLHAAASATGAIGEALHSAGKFVMEFFDQTRDGAHRVPQQGGIGGVMNVGFHYRGVDAQLLAVFQTELDGGLDHGLVDGLQRGRGESVEGAVEGVVLGNQVAVELGKAAQGIAVVDAFAQFAIVPVLDAHESQRAQGLRGGDAVAPGVGVLQAAHQIQADLLDQSGVLVQECSDALQDGVEMDALSAQFQIGEAELGFGSSAHGCSD